MSLVECVAGDGLVGHVWGERPMVLWRLYASAQGTTTHLAVNTFICGISNCSFIIFFSVHFDQVGNSSRATVRLVFGKVGHNREMGIAFPGIFPVYAPKGTAVYILCVRAGVVNIAALGIDRSDSPFSVWQAFFQRGFYFLVDMFRASSFLKGVGQILPKHRLPLFGQKSRSAIINIVL